MGISAWILNLHTKILSQSEWLHLSLDCRGITLVNVPIIWRVVAEVHPRPRNAPLSMLGP